jgi:hypothetical protein
MKIQGFEKMVSVSPSAVILLERAEGGGTHSRLTKTMPKFARYLSIDYSGAQTPYCSLKGLRVYMATPSKSPTEVPPPPIPRKHWTRRGLAEWLAETLRNGPPTLVGIDHAFPFRFGISRSIASCPSGQHF